MKHVKHIAVKKKEILSNIVLTRAITLTHLKYVGKCKIGKKVFKGNIDLDISTYHQNKDDKGEIRYIDNFAKQEIAKQIINEINGK